VLVPNLDVGITALQGGEGVEGVEGVSLLALLFVGSAQHKLFLRPVVQ